MMDVDGPSDPSASTFVDSVSIASKSAPQEVLVKLVRNLDHGEGKTPSEKISELWRALTKTPASQFPAVETSALRWLLKTMHTRASSPQDSEHVRRYPLTWNTINCIFKRVPLFSLAKALADRRFISILQRTIEDISKPSSSQSDDGNPTVTLGKRKKSDPSRFELSYLRRPEGCMGTAEALYSSLQTLLSRVESSLESSRDSIGAEHVRSLFSSSSSESAALLSPLLTICRSSLEITLDEPMETRESWVRLISTIWELRLHSDGDAFEVCAHLSRPALLLWSTVNNLKDSAKTKEDRILAQMWERDLTSFLLRNLILPARTEYIIQSTLEVLTMTVAIFEKQCLVCSRALFSVVLRAPDPIEHDAQEKGVTRWISEVLKAIEAPLRHQDSTLRAHEMEKILAGAIDKRIRLDEQTLHQICLDYALLPASTNWSILSNALVCEPDTLFYQSEENNKPLVDTLFDKISGLAGQMPLEEETQILKTMEASVQAFVNARSMGDFFKKWYVQVCRSEDLRREAQSAITGPWLHDKFRYSPGALDAMEASMTANQIVEVLNWMKDQRPVQPGALYIILDAIAFRTIDPGFRSAVGTDICSLVLRTISFEDIPSEIRSLRWCILSQTLQWADPSQRDASWKTVRTSLTAAVETGDLFDVDTMKAFQLATEIWQSMTPDGEFADEAAHLVRSGFSRLSREASHSISDVASIDFMGKFTLPYASRIANRIDLDEKNYLDWYLGRVLLNSSKVLQMLSIPHTPKMRQDGTHRPSYSQLPDLLEKALSACETNAFKGVDSQSLEDVFDMMFINENNINSRGFHSVIVSRAISILENSLLSFPSAQDKNTECLRILLRVPDECITRAQREKISSVLLGQIRKLGKNAARVSPSSWRLILAILTKIMRYPTFYQDMVFDDLVVLADAVNLSFVRENNIQDIQSTKGLAVMYLEFVMVSIQQITQNLDDRAQIYLGQVASFLSNSSWDTDHVKTLHLRLLLLKGLSVQISRLSGQKRESLPIAPEKIQGFLFGKIQSFMQYYAESWGDKSVATDEGTFVHALLSATEASTAIEPPFWEGMAEIPIKALEKAAGKLTKRNQSRGWALRVFLLRNFSGKLKDPRPADFSQYPASSKRSSTLESEVDTLDAEGLETWILRCIDAITERLDYDGKLSYLERLVEKLDFSLGSQHIQLLVIRNLVNKINGSVKPEGHIGPDVSKVFDTLTERLYIVPSGDEFCRVSEIVHLMLDQNSAHLTQWNIEKTLGVVSHICSSGNTIPKARQSEYSYEWLCRLVEAIIRKSRVRLEGHSHLLISTLQSLLGALLYHPFDAEQQLWATKPAAGAVDVNSVYPLWDKHASIYNRLLTLVCEPSAAAVTRSRHGNALESVVDVAKRSAGRHMYLILLTYIKIQLNTPVRRSVRDALETGMNSIFDITPPEVRKILNDALDASGRALLVQEYKKYRQFGKWSGI